MRTDIRLRSLKRDHDQTELFHGATIDVAKRLIGATLYRRIPRGEPDEGELVVGRIVETEAYLPLVDPACHGYGGPTARNAALFGRPGFAYVYFIYGMYHCLNVTTEPPGIGAAVLIRALEPIAGIEVMQRRRGADVPIAALACGPGNLCRALSIDRRSDKVDLRRGELTISSSDLGGRMPRLGASGRIGLSVAKSWPLRFFDATSPSVSPFRANRRATQENGVAADNHITGR